MIEFIAYIIAFVAGGIWGSLALSFGLSTRNFMLGFIPIILAGFAGGLLVMAITGEV